METPERNNEPLLFGGSARTNGSRSSRRIQNILFECSYCPEKFSLQCNFTYHEALHQFKKEERKNAIKSSPLISEKNSTTKSVSKNQNCSVKKSRKLFECFVCEKKFTNKRFWNNHQEIHQRENLWSCCQCPEIFECEGDFLDHERVHQWIESIECHLPFDCNETVLIYQSVETEEDFDDNQSEMTDVLNKSNDTVATTSTHISIFNLNQLLSALEEKVKARSSDKSSDDFREDCSNNSEANESSREDDEETAIEGANEATTIDNANEITAIDQHNDDNQFRSVKGIDDVESSLNLNKDKAIPSIEHAVDEIPAGKTDHNQNVGDNQSPTKLIDTMSVPQEEPAPNIEISEMIGTTPTRKQRLTTAVKPTGMNLNESNFARNCIDESKCHSEVTKLSDCTGLTGAENNKIAMTEQPQRETMIQMTDSIEESVKQRKWSDVFHQIEEHIDHDKRTKLSPRIELKSNESDDMESIVLGPADSKTQIDSEIVICTNNLEQTINRMESMECDLAALKITSTNVTAENCPKSVTRRSTRCKDLYHYHCTECDKRLKTIEDFKRHLLEHASQLMYKCEYCESKFGSKMGKTGHERRVHLQSNVKSVPMTDAKQQNMLKIPKIKLIKKPETNSWSVASKE